MKVSIEVPENVIRKAAHLLLSQVDKHEDEDAVYMALDACSQDGEADITDILSDVEKDAIQLSFAIAALLKKIKH